MLVAESQLNISKLGKWPVEVNLLVRAEINRLIYGGSFITYFTSAH